VSSITFATMSMPLLPWTKFCHVATKFRLVAVCASRMASDITLGVNGSLRLKKRRALLNGELRALRLRRGRDVTPGDPILEFLRARGADRIAHPGGTLFEHLRRTARTLESWGASPALVAAGLCHAAYGTDGFPTALLPVHAREEATALIGPEAETIVYLYCSSDRGHGVFASREAIDIRDRFTGARYVPSEPMLRAVVDLTCANELDVLGHADGMSRDDATRILDFLLTCRAHASPAARDAVETLARANRPHAPKGSGRTGNDRALAYRAEGTDGPTLVLVHGGAGPELTWSRQEPLSSGFRLLIPWRRGFGASAAGERQDWEADAQDLLRWIPDGIHLVAHSYGGVGAAVAASLAPARFASVTLVEPPLWFLVEDEPAVQRVVRLARAFSSGEDPEARARFLELAGLPRDHPDTARAARLARSMRDPGEARPDFTPLRAARLPVLIASGAHDAGIERVCDALADATGGQRFVAAGAGHAVQRLPSFNERLVSLVLATRSCSRRASPSSR
jgi:pimeloyl-ACP methyl ester carboxylesterase